MKKIFKKKGKKKSQQSVESRSQYTDYYKCPNIDPTFFSLIFASLKNQCNQLIIHIIIGWINYF